MECRFLKVNFESVVTLQTETDYLRCSPMFHGTRRNDGIIYRLPTGALRFGMLHFVFVFMREDDESSMEPVILLRPMDIPIGPRSCKDVDLGLHRVRACTDFCFVSARSIVRGALLVNDPDSQQDFFAVDVVDTDMFLRFRSLFPQL